MQSAASAIDLVDVVTLPRAIPATSTKSIRWGGGEEAEAAGRREAEGWDDPPDAAVRAVRARLGW
jgi:hypothetical protein